MESIVTFTFPEAECLLTLNRRGPRKYGSILELLVSGTGEDSTISRPDSVNMVNRTFRISTKYTSMIDFQHLDREVIEAQLKKLVSDGKIYWQRFQKYEVLEYLTGGFFSEHQDKRRKKTHCATLLIFPPAIGALEHVGGELVLDRGRFKFDSSANKVWTFIAFHTNLPHECKQVLSGRRVVFKTELYSTAPVQAAEFDLLPPITA